jgi:GT2 family glycosyltransferase
MLSIIVAVHNQIGHNTLFLESVRRYTSGSYEVVVVDNHSTDGSAEFFENNGCLVIRNDSNLCYPESMNLGLQHAKGDYVCLINNDLYVGPNWNEILIAEMGRVGLCAASPLGLEMMPTPQLTAWMQDRWASIGRGRLSSGKASSRLRMMIREMYGDWEEFCAETRRCFSGKVYDGMIGACVMLRRDLFEKIGLLDQRVQAADWDLYYTLRKRENEVGDIRRCMIAGGSYVHHFMRATVKANPEPFACRHNRLAIDDKWTREEQIRLWCKPEEFLAPRWGTSMTGIIRGRLVKLIRKLVREVDRAFAWRWLLVRPAQIVKIYKRKFMTIGSCS